MAVFRLIVNYHYIFILILVYRDSTFSNIIPYLMWLVMTLVFGYELVISKTRYLEDFLASLRLRDIESILYFIYVFWEYVEFDVNLRIKLQICSRKVAKSLNEKH